MKKRVITVGIVALLVAGCAAVFYLKRLAEARATYCEGCMCCIESAKQTWAIVAGKTNGPVDIDEVSKYLKRGIPECPSGGKYTIGGIGEGQRCSVHGPMRTQWPK